MSSEILIVDDNADIRNIINELILDAGYKTRLAANYNQALSEIDKKLPDVAILDVKLDKGDNDGIELLSHIKTKNKDVPVIIISGHANIEMAVKSLKNGAFEFIEKPVDQVVGICLFNKLNAMIGDCLRVDTLEIESWQGENLRFIISESSPENALLQSSTINNPWWMDKSPRFSNFTKEILTWAQLGFTISETNDKFKIIKAVSYTHLTLPTNREV